MTDPIGSATDNTDSVFEPLAYLQSLPEAELRELVLIPLLEAQQYVEIRHTHGPSEAGKDLIFSALDPLAGRLYYAATVKAHKLVGAVDSNKSVQNVYFQVNQALKEPFNSPFDGQPITISVVYVITPFEISPTAANSITGQLRELGNRVRFIDGPTLVSHLEKYCPDLLSAIPDPTIRYLHTLSRRFMSSIRLTELGAPVRLTLPDIYTGGKISPTTPEDARTISFARPAIDSTNIPPLTALSKTPHMVILADVGAGKTTLLNKTALDVITSEKTELSGLKRTIPVLVPLHQLPTSDLVDYSRFCSALQDHVRDFERRSNFQLANARQELLLLDGFDELRGNHKEVAGYIESLTRLFPKGIIVTSRPSRIPDINEKYFKFYKLNSFIDIDIKDFLYKWHRFNDSLSTPIYNKITSDESVHNFCRNPLFLTLYTILASRFPLESLPTRRTDIYTKISHILLGEWDSAKAVMNEYSSEIKDVVLQAIAFSSHSEQKKEFEYGSTMQEATIEVLELVLPQPKVSKIRLHSKSVLDELIYRSSLIRECPTLTKSYWNRDRDYWEDYKKFEFTHLSFQEFYAAKYLIRNTEAKRIQELLLDDWWRNALVFYFGLRQSMDGIPIPPGHQAEGRAIAFIEYLQEGTFTSLKTRGQIYQLMARELLYSTRLSSGEFEICARSGDGLLDAVRERVRDKKFGGIVYNYFKLILMVHTPKARSSFREDAALLSRINDRELLELLCENVNLFRDDEWLKDLRDVLAVSKKNKTIVRSNSEWSRESRLKSFSESIRAIAQEGSISKKDATQILQVVTGIIGNK
jgi:hypothetical protein